MGSVSNLPSGIAVLTQRGTGLLADLPVRLSSSTLQSASQQDLEELASSALHMQQVDGTFGIAPPARATSALPVYRPTVQAAVADEAAQQQLVQALFYAASSLPGTTGIVGSQAPAEDRRLAELLPQYCSIFQKAKT